MIKYTGYEWGKLPPGSLIIDVGGGVGPQSLTLARRHSGLRFVVQDREAVIADANEVRYALIRFPYILIPDACLTQYWKRNMPDALDSGRVRLQGPSHFILAFPRDECRYLGFSSPQFLRPAASAGGRHHSLPSMQGSPLLGGRILRHNLETSARRGWAQDAAARR